MSEEAQKAKLEGNEAYKKKDFTTAMLKYGKAIELNPNEITYYLNMAAVHFEMKNSDASLPLQSSPWHSLHSSSTCGSQVEFA